MLDDTSAENIFDDKSAENLLDDKSAENGCTRDVGRLGTLVCSSIILKCVI